MTTFPGSPRLLKGALIGFDVFNPLASVIVFQYNPTTLTRTVRAQSASNDGAARSEALRLTGPPSEDIQMDIEIDATDQLEAGDGLTESMGIHPQLAALEMLLYPKTLDVLLNSALAASGTLEILPSDAPATLLVWGIKRVVPVRLNEFTITEEAYDPSLNPIRAKVGLSVHVLNYQDFAITDPGFHLFLAHQIVKETMATISSANAVADLISGAVPTL